MVVVTLFLLVAPLAAADFVFWLLTEVWCASC